MVIEKMAYFGPESVAQFAPESVAYFGPEWVAQFGPEYALVGAFDVDLVEPLPSEDEIS